MSPALEKMHYELLYNTVPNMWEKFAYPSLAPLGTWVQVLRCSVSLRLLLLYYFFHQDLRKRIEFLSGWLLNGPPLSYWLSSFFFPQVWLS
jgi:dynein heavy chain